MATPETKCSVYAESFGKPKLNDLISVKLTPELLSALENGELEFKASECESFLCSKTKTYKLSGSSCNPTQCLMGTDKRDLGAFCLGTAVKSSLVADKVPGQIDWDTIPIYSSQGLSSKETLESVSKRSFCSKIEFDQLWKDRGGVVVDGHACVVSDDLVHKIGIELNSSVFSESTDDFEKIHRATTQKYPKSLYEAVFKRFWPGTALPKWIGIQLLLKNTRHDTQAFLARWKRDLLGIDVSLALLSGHYIDLGATILTVDRESLPSDPKQRLEYLFKIKGSWVFDEVVPFYSDLTDISDRRGTEAYLKTFSKVMNTRDPSAKGKIMKIVQPLR